MFFYEYPTLSYHLKAVFYFIWYFLLCFSEIPFTIDCRRTYRSYVIGNKRTRYRFIFNTRYFASIRCGSKVIILHFFLNGKFCGNCNITCRYVKRIHGIGR